MALVKGLPGAVELVIARDDLERAFAPVAEHDEIAQQREEPARVRTRRATAFPSRVAHAA